MKDKFDGPDGMANLMILVFGGLMLYWIAIIILYALIKTWG